MGVRAAIILMMGAFVAGCASPGQENFLHDAEKALGTDTALYQKLHRVAHYPTGLTFNFSGYLIGVEKSPRESVTGDEKEITDLFKSLSAEYPIDEPVMDEIKRLLSERKAIYPTHIVRYRADAADASPGRVVPCFTYLAYGSPKEIRMCPSGKNKPSNPADGWPASAWKDGIQAIRDLDGHITDDIEKAKKPDTETKKPARPYTHILVYIMGWNTAQEEAVRNFNSLVGELLTAVPAEDRGRFHPLVIGVSWPSLWDWSDRPILSGFDFLVKAISYGTKANDADEVGLVPVNVLLHQVLRPIKSKFLEDKLKIVVIGHSFGARVASRAAYSGDALKPPGDSEGTVDLLIGLQGAFSVNRFMAGKGREGAPYQIHTKVKRVVLTASAADEAVATSFWAETAGDIESYVNACRDHPDLFDCRKVNKKGEWVDGSPEPSDQRVVYVNASELISNNASGTGGGAHSDIYRFQMGRFVWQLIEDIH